MLPNLDQLLQRAQDCHQQGSLVEAVELYDLLIELQKDQPEIRYKRANALFGLQQWENAIAGYDQAIAINSNHAKAFCNRGAAMERLGKRQEALESYDRALALNPADFLTYYNRATILKDIGQRQQALESYDRAVALNPEYTDAFVNRGNVLQELQRHGEAIASFDRAIALNPLLVLAFKGRGSSLHSLGRYEDAVESYNSAIMLDADSPYLLGMRRYAQMHVCDWSALSTDIAKFSEALQHGQKICTPYVLLALIDSPFLHRAAAEIWVRDNFPPSDVMPQIRLKSEKIRVGYFSPDFRMHPVAVLGAQVFECHDRSKFETIAFSLGPPTNDAMRTRLQSAFDRFVDVGAQSDSEVAALARSLGIDIAVDLSGFTEHSRSGIFALRAAPLQVNYLGYPGTMGAPYMDYLIADHTVIPESKRQYYCEKIVYLPHCYLPNDSTRPISKRVWTRKELGLPEQGFVFCCFNNSVKLTPAMFDRWMRILHRVEHSVLWLSLGNASAAANLRREAERRGMDLRRIIFAERIASPEEHLARLRVADLFLDTHPYNAHATAVDALWAGLPLLTYAGQSFAGRVGASLLRSLGMSELIAETPEQYEEMAVELALDPPRLAALRQNLAEHHNRSTVSDGGEFARHLEAAFTVLYEARRTMRPA
jgi:predicted O-linked N-acetylglucosamine transferase (SPINDLY family)